MTSPLLPSLRIQRTSKIMASVSLAICVVLPVGLSLIWLLAPASFFQSLEATHYFIPEGYGFVGSDAPLTIRLMALSACLVPNLCLVYGIWRLRRLFLQFHKGDFFTPDTVSCLRSFAGSICLYAVMMPLGGAILSVVTSFSNPEGHRFLSLTLGDGTLGALFVGSVLYVISSLMVEAVRISDENNQFV